MKNILSSIPLLALVACGSSQEPQSASTAVAQPTEAEVLPDDTEAAPPVTPQEETSGFTLKDLEGNDVSLAAFQGKTVVLEWFNPGCPFIVYAHGEGPLKDMPARVTEGGDVVWLAINSGKTAQLEPNQQAVANWNMSVPVLLDPDGSVGQQFGAKSTPHMFILDGSGEVVYQGGLDNAPAGKVDGEYVNYVEAALADIAAGRPVATPKTKNYGCGVKY